MKYIFQDIDGCLIPTGYKKYITAQHRKSKGTIKSKDEFGFIFSPVCAAKLNYIIRCTGAQVVIISDWGKRINEDDMKRMWKERGMIGEVSVAKKNAILSNYGMYEHSDKVMEFLKGKGIKDEDWIVIDDLPLNSSWHREERTLICDPDVGIDNCIMLKAIELLNGFPLDIS